MLEVVTMSSKGQFVVPKDIREEMGLEIQDKFVVVHDKDSILLKRIAREEANKAMANLLDKFSEKFKQAGISRKEAMAEIRKSRR